jgi:predicted RNase H-like HicB family nuclease
MSESERRMSSRRRSAERERIPLPEVEWEFMALRFRMEYWKDGPWFVGRLPQVPGVFSQGGTLSELEENIRDAYRMMLEEQDPAPAERLVETKEIEVPA